MNLDLSDAAAYCILLGRIHQKYFTKQFDGSSYRPAGDARSGYLWCTHGGDEHIMITLNEVVEHIQAFEGI